MLIEEDYRGYRGCLSNPAHHEMIYNTSILTNNQMR